MLIILFVIVVHKILYAKGPVATAHTYPYQPNGHSFKGVIPKVTRLPVCWGGGGGHAAARATPNNTRPQRRTAARARCVGGDT